jgi:hypothetical protein
VWAFELSHRGPEIAARLGVPALRFAPGPLAGRPDPEPVFVPVEPSREELDRAAALAAGIEDENLRKTVEKAVALSLATGRSDRAL